MPNKYVLALVVVAGAAMSAQTPKTPPLDVYKAVAEQYVKLVLAVGVHDADYVDAFYGPAEWKTQAAAAKKPLAAIDTEAVATIAALSAITFKPAPQDAEMWNLRKHYLTRQLESLRS